MNFDHLIRSCFLHNNFAGGYTKASSTFELGARPAKGSEFYGIRAVNTTDAMRATIEEIPYAVLHKITDRITHEVAGINRVLYDLTPKPIGTIEWE